jgi:hypothetical protein
LEEYSYRPKKSKTKDDNNNSKIEDVYTWDSETEIKKLETAAEEMEKNEENSSKMKEEKTASSSIEEEGEEEEEEMEKDNKNINPNATVYRGHLKTGYVKKTKNRPSVPVDELWEDGNLFSLKIQIPQNIQFLGSLKEYLASLPEVEDDWYRSAFIRGPNVSYSGEEKMENSQKSET